MFLSLGAHGEQKKRIDCQHDRGETQHTQYFVHDSQKQTVYRDNVSETENKCYASQNYRVREQFDDLIVVSVPIYEEFSLYIDSKYHFA